MAQTLHANLADFEAQVQVAYYEKQYELFDYFNANSAGALSMAAGEVIGETPEFGFFADRDTGGRRDDTSVSLRSLSGHTQSTMKGVVIQQNQYDDAAISALKRQGIDPMDYARNVGERMAANKLRESFTSAISCFIGPAEKATTTKNDVSAASSSYGASIDHILDTKALLGDHSQALVCAIMHSKEYTAIKKEVGGTSAPSTVTQIAQGILMTDSLMDILGMKVIVSDNSALKIDAASPITYDAYKTLLLVSNAVNLTEDETVPMKVWEDNAYDNSLVRSLTEYNQTFVTKGFSYTGAVKPTDAAMATSSNWTLAASDVKLGPGCELITRN